MRVASSAVYLQLSRLTQTGLALVCSIILARSLGPAGLGAYATLLAFAVLFQACTSFGFEDLTLGRAPLYGGDTPLARSLYRTGLRIRAATVCVILALGAAAWFTHVPDPLPGGRHALALALAYSALNSVATLGAVIQASRVRAGSSAALDATWAFGVTASYVALLAAHRLSVETSLLAQAGWQGVVDVGYLAILLPLMRSRRVAPDFIATPSQPTDQIASPFRVHTSAPSKPVLTTFTPAAYAVFRSRTAPELLSGAAVEDAPAVSVPPPPTHSALTIRDSLNFWLNGFLSITTGKTTDLFAMSLASARAAPAGLYNAAYNLYLSAGTALVQGAGTMLYVNLGATFGQGDPARSARAWRTATIVSMLLSVPPLAYCIIMPHTLLSLMYGRSYSTAGLALVILAGTSLIGRVLGGGSNQALLFITRRQNTVLTVRSVAVAINVGLDIALYRVWGIDGVAAASGGCSVAIVALEFYFARQELMLRIPWGVSVRMAIPFFVSAALCSMIVGPQTSKSVILGVVLATSVLGIALLTLFKPFTAADLPDSASRKVKRVLMCATRRVPPGETGLAISE